MVELTEFAEAVAKMRTAQTAYFKRRTTQALSEAKKAEQVVDHYLKQIAATSVPVAAHVAEQMSIF